MIIEKYDESFEKLSNYEKELDFKKVSDFNISSTIRQMKLFFDITQNSKVKEFIQKVEEIANDKDSLIYWDK